jgi:hypothetical protein
MRRPRATWAQLLRAFGLRDIRAIIRKNPIDADTIPSAIDVPIQRIRLMDLGHMALIMGFTSVEVNVQKREFRATGPHGSITTEDLVNFGKVLRFEGDMFAIHGNVNLCEPRWLSWCAGYPLGRLVWGNVTVWDTGCRLDLFSRAVVEGWTKEEMSSRPSGMKLTVNWRSNEIVLGNLRQEALVAKDLLHDIVAERASLLTKSSDSVSVFFRREPGLRDLVLKLDHGIERLHGYATVEDIQEVWRPSREAS